MHSSKVQVLKDRRVHSSRGEITVFLTLTFVLFVSFVGSLMESASIQMAKNYRRADMNRSVESVFAEYQRELLEEFDVFGLDGSYETGRLSGELIKKRLSYYGASGIENEITRMQLMTDQGGAAFREQISQYIENKYGADFFGKFSSESEEWETQQNAMSEVQAFEQLQEANLENLLGTNEISLPTENNPLPNMQLLKNKPLLELVVPDEMTVSENTVELESCVSHRERQSGFGTFSAVAESGSVSTLAFGEYLLEHLNSAEQKENLLKTEGLQYELEYVIAGESSDKENLNEVTKKLLLLRMVTNYTYVIRDTEKRAEAEALALSLCSLALVPELAEVVTQALLLAWAFGESIIDIRSLLSGNKVPMVKSADSWQLSLSALLTLGTTEEQLTGKNAENGLSYKEYLRILLFLGEKTSGKETITFRALDMIEQRIRKEKGLEWFCIDSCISKLELESTCNLRRGITYQFKTYFGYR